MTGFALGYFNMPDVEPGWRLALIEDVDTGNGLTKQVWRSHEAPANAEELMAEIGVAVGEIELEGFTLFRNKDKWQMSTRRKNEPGWRVTFVENSQAQNLLSMLEPVSHPLGPMKIRASINDISASNSRLFWKGDGDRLRAELEAAAEARREHTAALLALATL